MSDIPRVIELSDICNESIAYVLGTAGFTVSVVDNEDIWIEKEGAMPFKIMINETDKMLVFQSSVEINASLPIADKHKFADELNRALLVRFYIYSDGILVGDYYLSYEHGMLTNQLVHTCNVFQHTFSNALRDKYEKNGVLDAS
jgi:hypothetical protein